MNSKHIDKEMLVFILLQVNNAGVGGMTIDHQTLSSFKDEVKI